MSVNPALGRCPAAVVLKNSDYSTVHGRRVASVLCNYRASMRHWTGEIPLREQIEPLMLASAFSINWQDRIILPLGRVSLKKRRVMLGEFHHSLLTMKSCFLRFYTWLPVLNLLPNKGREESCCGKEQTPFVVCGIRIALWRDRDMM